MADLSFNRVRGTGHKVSMLSDQNYPTTHNVKQTTERSNSTMYRRCRNRDRPSEGQSGGMGQVDGVIETNRARESGLVPDSLNP
ncbi:hypothetical protein BH18ACI4_BH18ACI4_18890 [soil metagenome]